MGFFSRIFSKNDQSSDPNETSSATETTYEPEIVVCTHCGEETEDFDYIDGEAVCYDCLGPATTNYCCGGIWDEGETSCPSCGESFT